MQLDGKRLLVTGGHGFFGRHIVRTFEARHKVHVIAPRSDECDLRDARAVRALFAAHRPEVIVHAAGRVGGIAANRARPAEFFYDNAIMGMNVIDEARRLELEKLVIIGTICSYPKIVPMPMNERNLWDGYPEETNAPYGLSKKMLLVHLQACRQQYGTQGIYLMPVNLYGPGDNFDPATSHVIPALVRRCLEARDGGLEEIEVWGTGRATREFLYVEDAASAVVLATERYEGEEPVNLGASHEVPIAELVRYIAQATGYKGGFRWNASMPDGQPRRSLDGSRAREYFGFEPHMDLQEGLQRTVDWYVSTLAPAGNPGGATS